jgi:uncharacterized phage protein (TIGR02218 family)
MGVAAHARARGAGVTRATLPGIGEQYLSLARAWTVTLMDGTVLGFTDHDVDVTIDGVTYVARTGYTASAIETSAALNVDNLELDSLLESPSITEDELLAGRWDHAAVEIFLFNWRDPAGGKQILRTGRLGQVSASGAGFHAEIRGLMQQLQQSIGQVYQPGCRADFGDDKCKFDKASVTFAATLTAVSADGRTLTAPALTQAADYFAAGELTWTSGPNNGLKGEVKTSAPGSVTLQLPPSWAPSVGDTFTAVAGCTKRAQEDCLTKFDNLINFRGEPHLPGMNKVMQTPTRAG